MAGILPFRHERPPRQDRILAPPTAAPLNNARCDTRLRVLSDSTGLRWLMTSALWF
jgi:hypothetical protein